MPTAFSPSTSFCLSRTISASPRRTSRFTCTRTGPPSNRLSPCSKTRKASASSPPGATLHFALDGQASHVARGDEDVVVPCEMTTIDDFVAENRLGKVDCIKLDVEGAEAEALRGGLKTIVKFKPKMAISLYHKPKDLYELPILAQAILPDARFYLGHHHAALHETILYVLPR